MDAQPRRGAGPARLVRQLRRPHPVELIAAVTDTLTNPAPPTGAPCDPYEPLQHIGWSPASADNALVSPDGTAYLKRLGSAEEPGAWFVTATLDRAGRCGRPSSARTLPPAWSPRSPLHSPIPSPCRASTAGAVSRPATRTS